MREWRGHLDTMRLEPLPPIVHFLFRVHSKGDVLRLPNEIVRWFLVGIGKVIEECQVASLAETEEEVNEVRVIIRKPSRRRYGVQQRETERIAVEPQGLFRAQRHL